MENKFCIIYDFDGTLTDSVFPIYEILNTINLNSVDVIKKYEYLVDDIKGKVNAFMYGYIKVLEDSGIELTKDNICLGAERLKYSKGVKEYFDNINNDAKESNVIIEHFVITSGMKEFIEKTTIAKNFKKVYGSSYYYENGKIKWPREVIESKNKVEKIFDINKKRGVKKKDCTNVIYIGDGITDYDSMKFVKENGGISICVYDDDLSVINKLKDDLVITSGFKRDYTKESSLYEYIKNQIINSKVGEK